MPAKKNKRTTEKQKKSAIGQYYEAYADGLAELDILTEEMKLAMNKDSISEVHMKHKNWLTKFEQLLHIEDVLRDELGDEQEFQKVQASRQMKRMSKQKDEIARFKIDIETFILDKQKQERCNDGASAISAKSKQSIISSRMSARLDEEQKKAELLARTKAMKEKHEIARKKLELQMQEEELQLRTELAIASARCEAIDKLGSERDGCEFSLPRNSEVVSNLNPAVSEFIPVSTNLPKPTTINGIDAMSTIVQQLRKPQHEITKFSGNPLEYQRFMRQFEYSIVANTCSDEERMSYLEQLTTDEAKKIVSGFACLEAKYGYPAALQELKERYGNAELITNEFIKRLLNWPAIKDSGKALDDFAMLLIECQHAATSLQATNILDYSENIRGLMTKLPPYLQDKFRNVIYQVKAKNETINFKHFVDFIRGESKKANDPVYGKAAVSGQWGEETRKKSTGDKNDHNRIRSSYALTVQPVDQEFRSQAVVGQKTCPLCSQNHPLHKCEDFAAMPVERRSSFIGEHSLCYGCFNANHKKRDCSLRLKCRTCNGNHNTLLHHGRMASTLDVQTLPKVVASTAVSQETITSCTSHASLKLKDMEVGEGECTMAIIPVLIRARNSMVAVQTYAFLDPGSNASFCSEELMQQLGVQGPRLKIKVNTMSLPHNLNTHVLHELEMCDLQGKNSISLPKMYTTDRIPVSIDDMVTNQDLASWPHLADVSLPTIKASVGLLIGNNVPDAYTPLEVKSGPRYAPHASKTLLGWIVWNVVRANKTSSRFNSNRIDVTIQGIRELQELENLYRESVHADFPESLVDENVSSQDDQLFMKKVNDSINLINGHYHISLPFKGEPKLPDNLEQAKQRLKGLARRLQNNPQVKEDYVNFMNKVIQKGYAEMVPREELKGNEGKLWYIPHHGVYNPKKPGKIRVVFDCAASFAGVSLNDILLSGPNLTNSLLGVLLRFRCERIALVSDIEAMFHQVMVDKKDRDFLRFLWWPGGNLAAEPVVYRMCVHLFGAKSSPSCANAALRRTAQDNCGPFDQEICNIVLHNFYMDDCLFSTDTEEKATSTANNLGKLCAQGGFHLTKWQSNCSNVLKSVVGHDLSSENSMKLGSEDNVNRVLGVNWKVTSDKFTFSTILPDRPLNRKGILSVISSVFDPMGMATPFTMVAKLLLQELCLRRVPWEQEIAGQDLFVWRRWLMELALLDRLEISRCYKPANVDKICSYQLHVFADASSVGYGVVVYVRLEDSSNNTWCSFVMSKGRVAPLKQMTIPRLELQAATTAVRIGNMVTEELNYSLNKPTVFWTDSTTVLGYIANETRRFKTFVANRVAVIRDGSAVSQWKYVDTKNNPADCLTRGMAAEEFLQNDLWFHGPEFLRLPESEWPIMPNLATSVEDAEVAPVRVMSANVTRKRDDPLEALFSRYSSWEKLKKTVAWILVIRERLLGLNKEKQVREQPALIQTKTEQEIRLQKLVNDKLEEAQQAILSYVQHLHFSVVFAALTERDRLTSKKQLRTSSLHKLNPFIEKGLIRVGGRLENSNMSYSAKHPVILPKDSDISRIIIENLHRKLGHLGRNTVLNALRQEFWIIGASSIAKKLLRKCVICRKYRGKPCEQQMANLPANRVTPDEPAFSHTGMDYFGPIEIKIGRNAVKRYGVIFTCLSSRAVHLEVAFSLDTDSCINAIRRFKARRGAVKSILSDNGTNFVGARGELEQSLADLDQVKMLSGLKAHGIFWEFNPPAASHKGGVWERLIRSTRQILYALIKEQQVKLNDEALQTLFCEIESILNGRPITKYSPDHNDTEALTPNHALLYLPPHDMPAGVFDKRDAYVRRRWRQIQHLADLFWKRWSSEYLVTLQERQRWFYPNRNITVGDIVLIVDNAPRSAWSLGRVTEVIKDKNGLVRIANVKTSTTELRRPVNKLSLVLEADCDQPNVETNTESIG